MSISSIGSTAGAPVTPQSAASSSDSSSASSASSSSSTTISNTAATTNSDGSVTTLTTYADGSTSTSTTAPVAKSGPGGVGRLLDGNNAAQGNTLLAAQAQANGGAPTRAAT
jgi:hypothetical protein